MATTVFDKILKDGVSRGIIPALSASSRTWYRNQAQNLTSRNINSNRLINSMQSQVVDRIQIGDMYLFGYDPKLKSTLPYYDKFPLIFPFSSAAGGFLGINMHYLPLHMRARLMDSLYLLASNKDYNETTKIELSYKILSSSSKYSHFKPCVKHYLNNQIKTRFVKIAPTQWDIALFLPLQRFEKASASKVYDYSQKIIKGI